MKIELWKESEKRRKTKRGKRKAGLKRVKGRERVREWKKEERNQNRNKERAISSEPMGVEEREREGVYTYGAHSLNLTFYQTLKKSQCLQHILPRPFIVKSLL